jgi:hypothetical protein
MKQVTFTVTVNYSPLDSSPEEIKEAIEKAVKSSVCHPVITIEEA